LTILVKIPVFRPTPSAHFSLLRGENNRKRTKKKKRKKKNNCRAPPFVAACTVKFSPRISEIRIKNENAANKFLFNVFESLEKELNNEVATFKKSF